MLRVHPFAAVRPASGKAQAVASFPQEMVSRREARELLRDNPSSFLHVVHPDADFPDDVSEYDDRVYEAGRAALLRLLREGAMRRDEERRVFLYRQEATLLGERHSQVGVVCCCDVQDYNQDRIKKHEETRQKKEDECTRHMLSVGAHTSPVSLTYRDQAAIDAEVKKHIAGDPLYDFTANDGARHTVWAVDDFRDLLGYLGALPAAYVADGHHRSASASRAAAERRKANPDHTGDEEYNRFLAVLFPASQLRILPYNRAVTDLNGLSREQFLDRLAAVGEIEEAADPSPSEPGQFCVYLQGQWLRVRFLSGSIDHNDPVASLDVALLSDRVLGPILNIGDIRRDPRVDFIGGNHGTKALEKRVDAGEFAAAFSMPATTIDQLLAVADAGLVMPPKSTWFEPKLRSGLLVHMLD